MLIDFVSPELVRSLLALCFVCALAYFVITIYGRRFRNPASEQTNSSLLSIRQRLVISNGHEILLLAAPDGRLLIVSVAAGQTQLLTECANLTEQTITEEPQPLLLCARRKVV